MFETVISIDKDKKITLNKYDMELNSLNKIAVDKVGLAHFNGHTPSGFITIDEKNENTMGELVHFFILSSIVGALLLDVNPFDQPGVEEYKKNMFALLGKPGYEEMKEKLEARINK